MEIEIIKLSPERIDLKELKKIGGKAIKLLKLKFQEISVVLVDDRKIKELNKKYRRKNEVTDVLTFDYGEIFICLPQAKKQAKKFGHSLKKELAILLIHGILHLAGYSDEKLANYDKIMKEQEKLIKKIINE